MNRVNKILCVLSHGSARSETTFFFSITYLNLHPYIIPPLKNITSLSSSTISKIPEPFFSYNPEQKILRCNGHTVNLAVQAFLFGKVSSDIDYLESLNGEGRTQIQTTDELDSGERLGLGELRNIVVYISLAPQRKQISRKLEPHLHPRRDNGTRWNSWFNMLDWAINKIKIAINQFCFDEEELKNDALNARTLKSTRDFLRHFHDAIKATEGKEATIEHFLPSMEFLIHQFEDALFEFADNHFMIGCLDAGYDKLLKYFNKHERSPAYIAAVVLNPRLKWTVSREWNEEDKKNAEKALFRLWKIEYRSNTGLPQRLTPVIHLDNTYLRWLAPCTTTDDNHEIDELEKYLQADMIVSVGNISAREWWAESSQRAKYPLFLKMAIEVFQFLLWRRR